MLFNSLPFLAFFSIVFFLYFFVLKHKHRWILLLISSYYFYMSWKPEYIVFILISTISTYSFTLLLYRSKEKRRKKLYLFFIAAINLGMLISFKYWNFFSKELSDFLKLYSLNFDPITIQLLLPVGISFYTFQTLSYAIDTYKGEISPTKHLGKFATYVAFFPQLVAGPIERAKDLLPQLDRKVNFDYNRITSGLRLMLWGLFKKVVIADNLAPIINGVYAEPESYSGLTLLVVSVMFAIQIYCDFSGYSDIAIGSSRVLGINLKNNFDNPYFSRSITEFWRRWHISLSSWLRDYVYIPLGGSKSTKLRTKVNILATFIISGVWHGANWTYIIWGVYHGIFLIIERIIEYPQKIERYSKISKVQGIFLNIGLMSITFIIITFGWIIFRAESLSQANYIINKIIAIKEINITRTLSDISNFSVNYVSLKLIALITFLMLILEYVGFLSYLDGLKNKTTFAIRWISYALLLIVILYYGNFGSYEFVYFQF